MTPDQAKLERCGIPDCPNRAVLTFRIKTNETPEYDCFCKKHLNTAINYLKSLASAIEKDEV